MSSADEQQEAKHDSHDEYVDLGGGKRLRVIFHEHERGKAAPLALFVHGLGGQAAQWQHQLPAVSSVANCLCVDMVGCGRSSVLKSWDDYYDESLVEDLSKILSLEKFKNPNLIFIGHSYGCVLVSLLYLKYSSNCHGIVFVSPVPGALPPTRAKKILPYIPDLILNLLRVLDRRGGLESASVKRMIYTEDIEVKKTVLKWNKESRTPVYKRFVCGINHTLTPDLLGKLHCALLNIFGEKDALEKRGNASILREWAADATFFQQISLPEVGHIPQVESHEQVTEAIVRFVERVSKKDTVNSID
ncbi:uncharacterized protein VTP21DRAFT_8271 [Calcarisporiella thermophila]|uniref:uncharacterized protein n=1 Tax=Calcarisporiella thermophila TaxID=911321 RepID=UPI0037446F0D